MSLVSKLKRPSAFVSAVALVAASVTPMLTSGSVSAYDLVASRNIKLSNSAIGTATDGQNVKYAVAFTTSGHTGGYTVGSVVVEFCVNSPIIGDSCTAPDGFDLNTGTSALSNVSGITGLSIDGTNSTANKLVLTRSAGNVAANTAVTFDLGNGTTNGVTNPTDTDGITPGDQVGTYYARISTKSAIDGTGAEQDAGGVALSTASQLTITSKVQERLTFCVYTLANCAAGGNAINLGDANGVLDPNTQYSNNATKFDLANNASSGVSVRMKGGTLKRTPACADGATQNCSIDPIGGSSTAGVAGGEQFGLRLTGSASNLAPVAPYNGGANNFAFDDNNTTGTQSMYGTPIASMAAGSSETATLEFVGNIANTTESGIYTTSLTFVATGTY